MAQYDMTGTEQAPLAVFCFANLSSSTCSGQLVSKTETEIYKEMQRDTQRDRDRDSATHAERQRHSHAERQRQRE